MPLTLALAQIAGNWEDPAKTLRHAEGCAEFAAKAGAVLLCFPEQFATGWSPHSPQFAEELGGPITRGLSRLAQEYSIALLGSFVQVTPEQPRNTCVVYDAGGGAVATYAKIHLFTPEEENRHYSPGESLAIFEIQGLRFGIAICYDLRFAPLFYLYARKQVDCVVVPAAWPCKRIRQWDLLIPARAMESQCYVAGVNSTGITPVAEYCGHSLIAKPTGAILRKGGEGEELICGEIDETLVKEVRTAIPVIGEYRNDLYDHLAREDG